MSQGQQQGSGGRKGQQHIFKFISREDWHPLNNNSSSSSNNNNNNSSTVHPLNAITKAFQSLSEDEQKRVQREKYGKEAPIEESTAFVNEKLEELDREINLLGDHVKKAYMEAIQQEVEQTGAAVVAAAAVERCITGSAADKPIMKSEEDDRNDNNYKDEKKLEFKDKNTIVTGNKRYVTSKQFRLMFLRAEKFNARMAARRITRHFNEKKELFEIKKLSRRIEQTDLSESDKTVLSSGCLCTTGATDAQGRLIVFVCRKFCDDVADVDSLRRTAYYFFQIVENNENWQKKGIVVVIDGRGLGVHQAASERRLYPFTRMVSLAFPYRISCTHLCYNSNAFHYFIKLGLVVTPVHIRQRIQTHYENNSSKDCFAGLMEYGINAEEDLPLTLDKEFRPGPVENFLYALRQSEEEASKESPHWLAKELAEWL